MTTELEVTELRLGLPGELNSKNEKKLKRVLSEMVESDDRNSSNIISKCQNKNQVIGWPPICSYRKKKNTDNGSKMYVKVSMDGAPFLRKLDLSTHKDYFELLFHLQNLFGCYGIGEALKEGGESSEYIPIYEDKDGDWMLVGDVPWQMFNESCKRLRIMRRSDAKVIGLRTKDFLKGMGISKDK